MSMLNQAVLMGGERISPALVDPFESRQMERLFWRAPIAGFFVSVGKEVVLCSSAPCTL